MADISAEPSDWGPGFTFGLRERALLACRKCDPAKERYLGCLAENSKDCMECKEDLSVEIHTTEDSTSATLIMFHLPLNVLGTQFTQTKNLYIVITISSLSITTDC